VFLILATFGELVTQVYRYNTSVAPEYVFPQIRLTRRLGEDPDLFRVMGAPPAFWPNYGAIYGLSHLDGFDIPVMRNYGQVYAAQGGKGYRQVWSADWPLVDWMNAKYVISPTELHQEKYELLMTGEGYWVYRNQDFLPRAYLVNAVEVITDQEEALKRLTSGSFDFRQRAILDRPLPPDQAKSLGGSFEEGIQAVRVTDYTNDEITFEVSTGAPGLLVMSEVYAPGWKASLDGDEVPLYPANYAFRGVFVPAGEHQIMLTYLPWEYQMGKIFTMIGLTLLLAGSMVAITKYLSENRSEGVSCAGFARTKHPTILNSRIGSKSKRKA
jgi:hypothetical protein